MNSKHVIEFSEEDLKRIAEYYNRKAWIALSKGKLIIGYWDRDGNYHILNEETTTSKDN